MNQIWDVYGIYDANQLEKLSHMELPWINARKGIDEIESSNEIITYKDMGEYYREILNEK